ncbi:hypothetical protein ISN75_06875 [Dyella marensis]|uniref:hypothetical protein n=1 Tax=Dyella marensis TaxID=500610 RepID=UPI0031DCD044
MAGPVVLPQYQARTLEAQRRLAMAQALQQQSLSSDIPQDWNHMAVVPRAGLSMAIAPIAKALLANKAYDSALGNMQQLGNEQWQGMQAMMGGAPQASQGQPSTYGASPQPQQNVQGSLPSMGASGAPTASAPPQGQSYPAGGRSPMNPLGLDPGVAAMGYYTDPAGYMKDAVYGPMASRQSPTEFTKSLMQAGIDPASPLGRQLAQDQIAKQNYVAPTAFRGGGYMYDPKTGSMENLPQTPEGFQTVRGPDGQWMQIPVQHGTEAIAASEGAKAAGKAGYELATGYDQNGNPITTTVRQQAEGANGGSSLFPGYGGQGAGQRGALPMQLPAGTEALTKGFIERHQSVLDAARNAPADIQAFQAIDQAANQAKTGVGFDRKAAWQSMASVIPGIDPNAPDKVNADIIQKYSTQIATRNGGRSDAALDAALHSITNSQMSPEAIHDLTPSLIGLRMADLGRAQASTQWLNQHGNNPQTLGNFEQKWNSAYDPNVYRFQAMSPEQRAAFKAGMSKEQQDAFRQKIQALQSLGAI